MNKTKIITIENIRITVYKKNVKNLNLTILPPDGSVRISAPYFVPDEYIENFIRKKLPWIKKHVNRFKIFPNEINREYITGEVFYLKGRKYFMEIVISDKVKIFIKEPDKIIFHVPLNYKREDRERAYNSWLRELLKNEVTKLIDKWRKIIGVSVNEIRVRKMKTKWGSCNISKKRIWFSLDLIAKPLYCIEYVVVHELVHLLERSHNSVFKAYMDKFLPQWRIYERELKRFN